MERKTMAELQWHTSSYCAPSHCVEVAMGDNVVYVRSSRDHSRDPLEFDFGEWAAFIAAVRSNEFDLPGATLHVGMHAEKS